MPFEIVPDGTKIDFLGRRRIFLTLSAILIVLGLGEVAVRGIPLGIDFVGGTEIQLHFDESVDVDESAIRSVAQDAGFDDATVVRFGEPGAREYLIRFKSGPNGAGDPAEGAGEPASPAEAAAPAEPADGLEANTRIIRLEEAIRAGIGPFVEQRVEFVGPRVGEELRADGINALLFSAIAILLYVAFRFSARFAPGAVVAVVHDLVVTGGILVLIGVEFDLRILAAMLAILGYSLNDTIIIYDRIRENLELHTKADLEDVLNLSVNQTLSRTVLTSLTTMIALLCLYFLGGEVIRPFAFAMLIGIVVGTYSSVFVASPLLLFLEQRFGDSGEGDKKRGAGQGGTKRARNELRV